MPLKWVLLATKRGSQVLNEGLRSLQREECLVLMVEKENQHMPHPDYLNRLQSGDLEVGSRTEVVDWVWKVHAHFGFGPLSAYLSINYLVRFLSFYELPKGKTWMMQLLAVACLSLAAKMKGKKFLYLLIYRLVNQNMCLKLKQFK